MGLPRFAPTALSARNAPKASSGTTFRTTVGTHASQRRSSPVLCGGGAMTKRGPYKRRADRYRGVCACGEHAWAMLTKGHVTFVSPEDARHLTGLKWYAAEIASRRARYAARTSGRRGQQKLFLLHRVILGESASDIDHNDRDGRARVRPRRRSTPPRG
jgi:hypothetical protein